MEINLSNEMIRTVHSLLGLATLNQLQATKYGEVDGEEALQLFEDLVTEIRLAATNSKRLSDWMSDLAGSDEVTADPGPIDQGVRDHLNAWLAKWFWYDNSRQNQARSEILRFLERIPSDEIREWFDKGWTQILEAAEHAD